MDIQHLLGRLEAILLEARRVPGTKMKLVDADRCFQLIDQMVLAIPEEIKKAQRIQQEHDRIIAQAKEEAERIKEMAGRGMLRKQMAHELGLSDAALAMALSRLGLSLRGMRNGHVSNGRCPYCTRSLFS